MILIALPLIGNYYLGGKPRQVLKSPLRIEREASLKEAIAWEKKNKLYWTNALQQRRRKEDESPSLKKRRVNMMDS